MQKKNIKVFIFPLVALAIFTLLVFAAGYAYLTSTISMNTTNYQVTLPKTTVLTCTKTDCGITITPAMMTTGNVNATSAKTSSTCSVACTCSGTQGSVCNYSVSLLPIDDFYSPSSGLGTSKELTSTISSPSGCTAQNGSAAETQANTIAGKYVSRCSLTVPASGSISATVSATFKWYNQNLNQSTHAGKSYKYHLRSFADNQLYQMLDYITLPGNSYIDTGYSFNPNTDGYLTIFKGSQASQDAMIVATATRSQQVWTYHASAGIYIATTLGGSAYHAGDTTNIHITTYNNKKEYYDGVLDKALSGNFSPASPAPNLIIGALINGTEKGWYYKGNIYGTVIYSNGSVVKYLVPAKRKSDNVLGLYDLIGGGFYINSGTGTITAGSNI